MDFEIITSGEELEKAFGENKPNVKPPHVVIFYWYDGSFRNVIRDFAPNHNLKRNTKLESQFRQQENYCGLTRQEIFAAFTERFELLQGWYMADLKNREYFFFKESKLLDQKLKELSELS
ncbi:MAG: hypothetical protein HXY43_22400 [Fischerella sp.]|jgi:hypothetical protein|uniref:hypothetical protein n=1 Tax=Fischerella sp. TaxID=1191 RepID=UPI0017D9669A|nr:hypothetical protein [Fischerella sp.]NWF61925.1 hypothetical protein [Fischerella sp.]